MISGSVLAWDSFTLEQWQGFTLDQWEAFRLDVSPYGGLDQFDRIVNNLWQTDADTPVAVEQVNYGYDLASNRLWRQNPVAQANSQNRDELYAYDGLYQLLDLSRGQLNSDDTAINDGTLNFAQAWELDPTGNWTDYKEDDTGGGFTFYETRAANMVNEITALTTTDPDWVTPAYDDNGNMTTMPQPTAPSSSYTAVYDAWNRLVSLSNGDDIVVQYEYDGLGRRVTKDIGGTIRDYYYSDSWQILEEQLSGSTEPSLSGAYAMSTILCCAIATAMARARSAKESIRSKTRTATSRRSSMTQARCLKHYLYSAYGVLTVLNPDFSVRGDSPSYDWETLYASYRWDSESGLYLARYRYFQPPLGVWIARDPIGSAGDAWNPYRYVLNNPIHFRDPSGTEPKCNVNDHSLGGRTCCRTATNKGTEWRVVKINTTILTVNPPNSTNQADVDTQIEEANKIWKQCCIKLVATNSRTLDRDDTIALIGKRNFDEGPEETGDTPNPQYQRFLKGRPSNYRDVDVYIVESFRGIKGRAGLTHRGIIVLASEFNGRLPNTLAHEIGHALGLDHNWFFGLMASSIIPFSDPGYVLYANECDTARRSRKARSTPGGLEPK